MLDVLLSELYADVGGIESTFNSRQQWVGPVREGHGPACSRKERGEGGEDSEGELGLRREKKDGPNE